MKWVNADLLKTVILLWSCKKTASIPKKYIFMQLFEGKLAMNCVPLSEVVQELCTYNRKKCRPGCRNHKANVQNKTDESGERM